MKKNRLKRKASVLKIVLATILTIYTIVMVYLLLWAFITSFKPHREFDIDNNHIGLPNKVVFENFIAVFKNFSVPDPMRPGVEINFWKQLLYTILYAGVGSLLSATAPFLMAYACYRFSFRFNKIIHVIVILTMIIPIIGSTTSMVAVLHEFKIYNTMFSVYCEKFSFANIYFLIFYGILKKIPKSYIEAAKIDGASEFSVMAKVIFPIVVNVFTTVMLIYFIAYWNDYQTPLLYMPSYPTLAYGVYYVSNNTAASKGLNYTTVKMACSMTLIIPIMILFIVFRNRLMNNLSSGGVKE